MININIIIIYAPGYKYCSYAILFFLFLVISTFVTIITFLKLVVRGWFPSGTLIENRKENSRTLRKYFSSVRI